ncbi:carbonic anhydrase family protein [Aquimarina sp. AD10]|uniref:Carbonic anhydrase n=1 Tax=Aquimarina aggregata TaxID=1642818 RepID=A0A162ZH48_9FLAO|nr:MULTISPECIES: carbonic anhydrase family protein [Aquimarina]AXT62091.1 carbonic anhydrase family protein [Aquimarina sp. AD10]KZS39791.1 hypothetical protein AWE51_09070 [Aquimarina aggregata]RKM99921.1 carbonic anhydrase family protein [Aquimarina sp. AD10]
MKNTNLTVSTNRHVKISILVALLFLSLSLLISCNNEEVGIETFESNAISTSEMELASSYFGKASASDCNFEYGDDPQGPEFWSTLCNGAWVDCAGNVQSPINIITDSVIEDGDINNININYTESKTDIFNNGHTLQFTYDQGSSASLNNIDYDLIQFHFHTGSEHTINGKQYPMEMHLVHQDPITKLLGVVGIFFEEGKKNEVLSKYLSVLPKEEGGQYVSRSKFKVEDLLPGNMEFYTYDGSLTTPGCSEIVTWYVVKESITASAEQLSRFESIMHKNYRPVQDLNGRTVRTKS